ncbi:TPA: TetR/AcrR family transcriptional regulator [Photobacterium damselae]|uniref:Transcriptional regulator n=5 Tax=Photobacterium damselae TaxID=38293 RepID=D0Z3P7_PHODD|nr:TetR/AcrR family transcriptional regulator [Photobacterium damselae]EEZ40028.1 transcriptional regulator [Photobacterium damselae subsp. damselae CIP 102761]EHA1080073.1 TetR/AcrR family transcriptional regulator [Photobacterium damselae]MBA5682870.1 TetR/AcrR family transcriptional regulator [Photobacterium damselae subsp. damselae]MCG3812186.1 TetR/AcrR family transcriptional regulator [Photobacterium damselae]MCG3815927.1 TetR/AcrR family transcriptional regulator [Photobacterium damsela
MKTKMTRSEQKHLAIIDAAKEEFIQHGFLAANMDRISAAAEVSKRTLYRHFESKEVLFESVLTIIQDEVNQAIQYPYIEGKTLKEQLTEITYKEVDILYNTYGIPLSKTIVMEFMRQPEMAHNLVKTIYSNKAITQWFHDAMMAGKLKETNLNLITNIYVSLFQGLLFWPQVMTLAPNAEGKELTDKVETVVSIFLASYSLES